MKIIIEIKGKEVTLTEDEARGLCSELQRFFSIGNPVYIPLTIHDPYRDPYRDLITYGPVVTTTGNVELLEGQQLC